MTTSSPATTLNRQPDRQTEPLANVVLGDDLPVHADRHVRGRVPPHFARRCVERQASGGAAHTNRGAIARSTARTRRSRGCIPARASPRRNRTPSRPPGLASNCSIATSAARPRRPWQAPRPRRAEHSRRRPAARPGRRQHPEEEARRHAAAWSNGPVVERHANRAPGRPTRLRPPIISVDRHSARRRIQASIGAAARAAAVLARNARRLGRERPAFAQVPARRVVDMPVHLVRAAHPRAPSRGRLATGTSGSGWRSIDERQVAAQRIGDEPHRARGRRRSSTSRASSHSCLGGDASRRGAAGMSAPTHSNRPPHVELVPDDASPARAASGRAAAAPRMSPSSRNAGASTRAYRRAAIVRATHRGRRAKRAPPARTPRAVTRRRAPQAAR